MEYTRLGNTGLKVSRLALGCMSYGDATAARAHRWALDEDASQPFFRQAQAGMISRMPGRLDPPVAAHHRRRDRRRLEEHHQVPGPDPARPGRRAEGQGQGESAAGDDGRPGDPVRPADDADGR